MPETVLTSELGERVYEYNLRTTYMHIKVELVLVDHIFVNGPSFTGWEIY